MKTVFMGTPEFAAVILAELCKGPHAPAAVYTQPDRPAGRGQALRPSKVKELARKLGLPVLQPLNFKDEREREELAAFGADVFLVAAYGLVLPQAVLDLPRFGAINVHGSLLPRWRGAAPIQRAIMAGDKMTGITIMQMEAGLDSGPMLLQRALGVDVNDDCGRLHDELAELGARLLLETLDKIEAGNAPTPVRQDPDRATYAAKLDKGELFLDFARPATEVHASLRALAPRPGARALLKEQRSREDEGEPEDGGGLMVILEEGRLLTAAASEAAAARFAPEGPDPLASSLALGNMIPGAVLGTWTGEVVGGGVAEGVLVRCKDAFYLLTRLRPAGGASLTAPAFANGYLRGQGWIFKRK